jgi:hypothetical protein
LISELNAADEHATALAETLTPQQLNWSPSPGVWFRNPFVPLIRFTVGTGLEILSKHERRHLLQAERIRESPNVPER